MSEVSNKETARRAFEDVFTRGDYAAIPEIFSSNLVQHHPDEPYETRGQEGIRARITAYRTAFPDLTTTVEDCFGEGDRVAIRYMVRGTNSGEIMGMEPTGKSIAIEAEAIYRFESGRVAEIWDAWNVLSLMQQLGLAS
ncbi:ester cyclase [Streptomyces purpureus]|uniref:Ester cyclase n=1 Tax=Streptomyces purpureus TaxID=1951 RepID=A0A918HJ04_9ACTN|nr:ester cyclase [Streptomyces purpureus]GGT67259.1 hypothetical protein GCM10014713_69610 [Streptomyces purpureus]